MTNPDQERENVRFGLDTIDGKSIRPLREYLIRLDNGHDVSEPLARLRDIEDETVSLRSRKAVLDGVEPPARPDWLDPAPKDVPQE